ncbi:MAG: hypothetical protein K2G45_08590 [Lachnospiraceae bacterium]|nr:hypothetical protein [Lachnospiraceae bacterium]
MKAKTKKRVILTLALAIIMTCAMSITAMAATRAMGLKQTGATTSTVSFAWTADPTAAGYYIYVSTDNVNFRRTDTSVYPDATDPNKGYVGGLSAGTTYYVKVQIVYDWDWLTDTSTTGDMSESIAVATAPMKVKSVKQTSASAKGVTLKWSKAAGATSYQIYRDNKKVATVTGTTATIKQTAGTEKAYDVYPVRTVGNFSAKGDYEYGYAKAIPLKPVYVANAAKDNCTWDHDVWNDGIIKKVRFSADKNNKDNTVDGFQFAIYTLDGKKKLKTITTNDNIYENIDLSLKTVRNNGFQVMARGYTKINGKKCWGAWSAKKVVIAPPVVKCPDVRTSTATVKWNKISGATKYYVYVAKNCPSLFGIKNYKRVATVNAKKTSYKISGLKKGKYYSVYVVPVVKIGKKSYKGVAGKYTWEGYRSNY